MDTRIQQYLKVQAKLGQIRYDIDRLEAEFKEASTHSQAVLSMLVAEFDRWTQEPVRIVYGDSMVDLSTGKVSQIKVIS